ncbi:hypothetical protein FFK22_009130 [Mycobacterium sp. KBS0706]|uniref:hypothetical protein n=1 Tax=Mycobacterium sp. KBS0706 TaxID=2578109 RepID=UPI00110FE2E8|nr:hypothetical protein [Mycobacterium sp. KBS0706]TSD89127.1 hypothetical protein FFK22_009130 [Mycobacterium sp. KBS0706]
MTRFVWDDGSRDRRADARRLRHAGELRVVTSGAVQVVYVDVNGDKVSDFAINVTADHARTVSDFVL